MLVVQCIFPDMPQQQLTSQSKITINLNRW